MRLVEKFALPLALAGFLVAGSGCMEQEQKAKDRGTEIDNSINKLMKKAEDTTKLATDKMTDLAKDLEEAVEEE